MSTEQDPARQFEQEVQDLRANQRTLRTNMDADARSEALGAIVMIYEEIDAIFDERAHDRDMGGTLGDIRDLPETGTL